MNETTTIVLVSITLSFIILPGYGNEFALAHCNNSYISYTPSAIFTSFPQYDWTRAIQSCNKNNFDLGFFFDNRIDLDKSNHKEGATARISTCDLLNFTWTESCGLVLEAINSALNNDDVVLSLLLKLADGAKIEEIVDGMEEGQQGGGGHGEADGHVWLPLRNTHLFSRPIANTVKANTLHSSQQIHFLKAIQPISRNGVENGSKRISEIGQNFDVYENKWKKGDVNATA
ncbi:MAG: hypothetical protein FWG10_13545 [Eubacteriaceae bacterium]|nr:hypothetical protein [Eubacteriaceae bacterium]